ncbi:MAG: sugar phosphate isomerase/epimerase family protein [Bryobacteraceae bacterium]
MTRRELFQVAAAALAAGENIPASNQPAIRFPTAPRARLAVASYPFRKFVNPRTGTLPLIDFPKMVSDRFGLSAIEPLDAHFPSTDAAYLEKFRAALHRAKSRVVNIPVGRLGGSFYDPEPANRKIAIDSARQWVDIASAIGSPSIRAHIREVKGIAPNAALASEALRQVAEYGASKNVVIHLENDDPRSEEPFFLVDVIAKAGTPWLRALPDFCNSMLLDKGEDYNDKALTALFHDAYGISHVKDSEQEGKKFYQIDLAKVFAIAKRAGYRGYFSMEYDAEGDPYAPTGHLIEQSLKHLSLASVTK